MRFKLNKPLIQSLKCSVTKLRCEARFVQLTNPHFLSLCSTLPEQHELFAIFVGPKRWAPMPFFTRHAVGALTLLSAGS